MTRDRHELRRVLLPFVTGTAEGMSSSVMTESRIAATARDAAAAIMPLLGTPAPSAHRVRRLIVPTLTCSWPELDVVFEDALEKLIALPPAIPEVADPEWDAGLPVPPVTKRDWNSHGSTWSASALEEDVVVGPSGTVGRLVQSDRRHALIVEDGRAARTRAHCTCPPKQRRERGEVAFELVTFGRGRTVLEVRVGVLCALCRAVVP